MSYICEYCLFYLVALCVKPSQSSPAYLEVRPTNDEGFIERSRRTFVTGLLGKKGALAVKSLTGDAVKKPSSRFPYPANNPVRQFQKKGDYSRAIQDLVAVFPDRIKDFSTVTGSQGKSAIVGDRILHLKSSNEFTGFPTIEILQVGGVKPGSEAQVKLTDLITYMP